MRHPLRTRALAALTLGFALSTLVAGVAAADGDPLAYVANEQAGTISQVDLTTGAIGTPIQVGSQPDAIAITPDGSTAYVADYGSSEIVPVALATGTVEAPIALNDRPNAIAITPNGKTAYVIADTGREWPIRLSTRQLGNPVQIPTNSDSVAISADGGTAYITDVAAGTVTPLSLSNGGLGQPINLGVSTPDGIAITPDGSTAYVASNSGGTITPVALRHRYAGHGDPGRHGADLGGDLRRWQHGLRDRLQHRAGHADRARHRDGRNPHRRRSAAERDRTGSAERHNHRTRWWW